MSKSLLSFTPFSTNKVDSLEAKSVINSLLKFNIKCREHETHSWLTYILVWELDVQDNFNDKYF